jgi:type IV secretory pathway TrbD component
MTTGRDAEGHTAVIHRALWERILTLGAPRMLSSAWLVLCAAVGLVTLFTMGFTWLLAPLVVWVTGQGLLVSLTQWDINFDDVISAHITRRYKDFYGAG